MSVRCGPPGKNCWERESWDDRHGTYDGFASSTPAALHRFDVRYRRDKILDHSSNEYLALADESEKLEAKALADDDEPKY
jgi:7-keto-8-aminopelargonate synthetase-like enzyme